MPGDIRKHLRYPSSLLAAQSRIWARYHGAQAATWLTGAQTWSSIAPQPMMTPGSDKAPVSIAPYCAVETSGSGGRSLTRIITTHLFTGHPPQNEFQTIDIARASSVAAALVAEPGQPLKEWRPPTRLSLDVASPPEGMQNAPNSGASFALIPYRSLAIFVLGRRSGGPANRLERTWGIFGPRAKETFKEREQALDALRGHLAEGKRTGSTQPVVSSEVREQRGQNFPVKTLRRLFEEMQQARQSGNWKRYGDAEKEIERQLERYTK
jgi:hypothetical protein